MMNNENSIQSGPQLPQVGDNIDGLMVGEILGWGSHTVVYKVLDSSSNDLYAIKMLTPKALESDESIERFKYEIKLLSDLNHPNIVSFHRQGVCQGFPYFLMDYVKGLDLESYLISKGQAELKRFMNVAMQLGSALEEIHSRGVIHRDVKLRNIMLKSVSFQVMLMDFGIAFESDRELNLTQENIVLGTPLYMAPELFKENNASVQSDIYAYAATLYQFITGAPPFAAANGFELYEKHANVKPKLIRLSRPEVPEELDELLIEHCLAKNPADRPKSISEVLEKLDLINETIDNQCRERSEHQAILVVDDEINITRALRRLLRSEKHQLLVANSGAEALEFFQNYEIKVLLTDQRMPEMTGLELAEKVTKQWPDTRIIILSGHTDTEDLLKAINQGVIFKFMNKPWDDQQLKQSIGAAIEQYDLTIVNKKMQQTIEDQNAKLAQWNSQLAENVKKQTNSLDKARQKLKKTLREVVRVLVEVMEIHSDGLRGHGRRVAAYAKSLAEKRGLTPDECELVETAGMLHDLGKISLPAEILKKVPVALSKEETRNLSTHPIIGYEILQDIDTFSEVAEMVKFHHERFNGDGFPDGLRGINIPLGARIIAVADLFDRFLNPQGTFLLGTRDGATEAILSEAGKKLDPKLVEIFVEQIVPHGDVFLEEEVELPPSMLKSGMVLARDVRNVNQALFMKSGAQLDQHLIDKLCRNDRLSLFSSHLFITRTSILRISTKEEDAEAKQAPNPAENSKTTAVNPNEYIMKKVVVVDDEPGVVRALTRELRRSKYQVIGFSDVMEAAAYLKENSAFALITDYNMPGLSGDRFVKQIQEERPGLPCIVITGFATKENVVKLSKAGNIVRVLTKPWDKEELLSTLENL